MARDPGSTWLPLPEAGAPDGYKKTQFIVHSTGSMAAAMNIRSYFAAGNVGVESTFVVGLDPSDPTLQIMDSTDRADANIRANERAIAVEVVGDGVGPFTDWQVSELIRLGRWAMANHPIEPRIIPSEPESGFGWHVMFGAPGPWTTARGKVCPGANRIHQLKTVIFPAIFAGSGPAPVQEDDTDMLMISNPKGVVALLTDFAVWVPDGASAKGLASAGVKTAPVSDKFFDTLVQQANREEGDLAGIRKAAEALLAKTADFQPVDEDKLAASLAAKINKG